jgi:hypothetical protein
MRIRIGYDLTYRHLQDTPIIAMLEVHSSRRNDLERLDFRVLDLWLPTDCFLDAFGNRCFRFVAPAGDLRISCETVVHDRFKPDLKDRFKVNSFAIPPCVGARRSTPDANGDRSRRHRRGLRRHGRPYVVRRTR